MMPTAVSRPRTRSPSRPITIPAASVKASSPQKGGSPMSTEPVAPAKPTWDSACPANARLRITRKNPTAPATTATTPPAANAVRMKSYSNIVEMSMGLDRAMSRHDEDAVLHAEDFDRRAVEPGKHFAVDHLLDRAERGLAVA